MGYFNAGFACHEEPEWSSLQGIPHLLGYAHNSERLFLLTCQEPDRVDTEHPFTEFVRDERYTTVFANALSPALIETLAKASDSVSGGYYDLLVRNALLLGQDLASRLKAPLLFFAVNDDTLNLSFTQDAEGKLTAFRFQSDGLAELHEGKVRVCPVWSEEDDEEFGPDPADLDGSIAWGPANTDPMCFGSAPLKLWPAGWPDPEKAFGLGTWDILAHFSRDFTRQL